MKTAKIKGFISVLMLSLFVFAFAEVKVGSGEPPRFQKERKDIRKDLVNIEQDKKDLATWNAELKADKKAGLKLEEAVADRKEIAKARADLMRDKRYLRADRKDLNRDYRLTVKEEKKELRGKGAELCDAKAQLRKDLRNKNAAAIEYDAAVVAALMRSHDAKETALLDLEADRKGDLIAVSKEVKESKQEQPERTRLFSER